MLVVDYLIGNNDRHTGNFAILWETTSLAPMYDNGSSLACRLDPNSISDYYKDIMRYDSYVFNKPRSACLDSQGKEYKHIDLMCKLLKEHKYDFTKALAKVEVLNENNLIEIMSRFENVAPKAILEFNVKVILDRLIKLKEMFYDE